MTREMQAARHEVGLPRFERECPVKTMGGKLMKAYRIPGTPEHGRWCSLSNRATEIARRGS